MRVFLDQDVPHNIRRHLKPRGHEVVTAFHQGWSELENGDLLQAIEEAGFEVLVTADQNLEYQQNLTNRKIALIVLGNGNWPIVQDHLAEIVSAVDAATQGSYAFIEMPLPPKRLYVRSDD
jgi:hypothetical protein